MAPRQRLSSDNERVQEQIRMKEILGTDKVAAKSLSPRSRKAVDRLLPVLECYNYGAAEVRDLALSCGFDELRIEDAVSRIMEEGQNHEQGEWQQAQSKDQKRKLRDLRREEEEAAARAAAERAREERAAAAKRARAEAAAAKRAEEKKWREEQRQQAKDARGGRGRRQEEEWQQGQWSRDEQRKPKRERKRDKHGKEELPSWFTAEAEEWVPPDEGADEVFRQDERDLAAQDPAIVSAGAPGKAPVQDWGSMDPAIMHAWNGEAPDAGGMPAPKTPPGKYEEEATDEQLWDENEESAKASPAAWSPSRSEQKEAPPSPEQSALFPDFAQRRPDVQVPAQVPQPVAQRPPDVAQKQAAAAQHMQAQAQAQAHMSQQEAQQAQQEWMRQMQNQAQAQQMAQQGIQLMPGMESSQGMQQKQRPQARKNQGGHGQQGMYPQQGMYQQQGMYMGYVPNNYAQAAQAAQQYAQAQQMQGTQYGYAAADYGYQQGYAQADYGYQQQEYEQKNRGTMRS